MFVEHGAEHQPSHEPLHRTATMNQLVRGDDRETRIPSHEHKDHRRIQREESLLAKEANETQKDGEVDPHQHVDEKIERPRRKRLHRLPSLVARPGVHPCEDRHGRNEDEGDIPGMGPGPDKSQGGQRDQQGHQMPQPDLGHFARGHLGGRFKQDIGRGHVYSYDASTRKVGSAEPSITRAADPPTAPP